MRPKGIVINDNEALEQVRKDSGHTQKAMASLVGCDERHWRRYENGETGVPEDLLETLQRLAGEGIVKIRDPDGLAEAIGPPGSKKVPAPKNEDQNPAQQSSPEQTGLPPAAFEMLQGAQYIAISLLGWTNEQFMNSSPGQLWQQTEQYLVRHPEDHVTRAWLKYQYDRARDLSKRYARMKKAELNCLGADFGEGKLQVLAGQLDVAADLEHVSEEACLLRQALWSLNYSYGTQLRDVQGKLKTVQVQLRPNQGLLSLSDRRQLQQKELELTTLEADLQRQRGVIIERARKAEDLNLQAISRAESNG